jgi:hypothetical protein
VVSKNLKSFRANLTLNQCRGNVPVLGDNSVCSHFLVDDLREDNKLGDVLTKLNSDNCVASALPVYLPDAL